MNINNLARLSEAGDVGARELLGFVLLYLHEMIASSLLKMGVQWSEEDITAFTDRLYMKHSEWLGATLEEIDYFLREAEAGNYVGEHYGLPNLAWLCKGFRRFWEERHK